ncbi:MAG: class I SAM-dependent rRNA methyltransferase [Candidatus Gracilibacteria bacterium]
MYPKIHLKAKLKKTFLGHKHPWIFSGAIERIEGEKSALHGRLVSIFLDGIFLAHGYYNKQSQIAVRILSWNEADVIDVEFFKNKISQAAATRREYVLDENTTACRMVFAESDFLPGFIVDKYNNTLILQIHTLGAENLKDLFVQALIAVYSPECIYEKSDVSARKLEGLPEKKEGVLHGTLKEEEIILEHGLKFRVDFLHGQKTGFFLDQRENRLALQKYVKDRKVLNICSYTGGFSVSALQGGASHVSSVDISDHAVEEGINNVELNGFDKDKHWTEAKDAFEFLKNAKQGSYDVIILDPPAFVKSKKDIDRGMKGYISLNQRALEVLDNHGILMTCSCSGVVSDEQFFRMLSWAAQAAGCLVQVLEKKSQPLDHSLNPYFPEGNYLKCYIIRKIAS